jgi:hypothetical protein
MWMHGGYPDFTRYDTRGVRRSGRWVSRLIQRRRVETEAQQLLISRLAAITRAALD